MAVMLPVMYFLMIRPQQQKAKEAANLLAKLKAGDEVVTTGGMIGRVKSVADQFVTIEIAANTAVKVMKTHIASLTKTA
jgi:preprotein translocase subunit YajC